MSALAEATGLNQPEPELSGEVQGIAKPGLIKEQAPLVQVAEVQTDTATERPGERQVLKEAKAGKGEKNTDARFQPPAAAGSASDSSSDPALAAPPIETTGQDPEGSILGRQSNHPDIEIMAMAASPEPLVAQAQNPIADHGQGDEFEVDADVCFSATRLECIPLTLDT